MLRRKNTRKWSLSQEDGLQLYEILGLFVGTWDFFVTGKYMHEPKLRSAGDLEQETWKSFLHQSEKLPFLIFFPYSNVSNILCIDFTWLKVFVELLYKYRSHRRKKELKPNSYSCTWRDRLLFWSSISLKGAWCCSNGGRVHHLRVMAQRS